MSLTRSLVSAAFILIVFGGLVYLGGVDRSSWDRVFMVVFGYVFADWTVEILNTRLGSSRRVPAGVSLTFVLLAIVLAAGAAGGVASFLNFFFTVRGSSYPVEIGSAAICVAVYAYTRAGFSQHVPVKRLESARRT